MIIFNTLFLLVCFLVFAARRALRYLHIFQQEDYDVERFVRWFKEKKAFDRRVSVGIAAIACILLTTDVWIGYEVFVGALFAAFAIAEKDPRKAAKKKLVITSRAKRIFSCSLLISAVIGVGAIQAQDVLSEMLTFSSNIGAGVSIIVSWIIAVQLIPFSLIAANTLLKPFEKSIQRSFAEDASKKLAEVKPRVVAITGSFGKTSVKHILGHILEMNAPTLFTPGSINTLMGISRIIREQLKTGTQFFIVEMGAYGKGSIAKLCQLTPPSFGIITAVGEAHYERFKSLDAVAQAKFELAEASLSTSGGRVVIHESVLAQDYAKTFVASRRQHFVIVGTSNVADFRIQTVEQTLSGLTLTLAWKDQEVSVFAPLYGKHHAGNIALAFVSALELGIPVARAVTALRTTPQIKHRLEVKPQIGGVTYIDDGFNSNPLGFSAALDLLSTLARAKKGRSILITPGIVELGERHDAVHHELGLEAAGHADLILLVRAERIQAFGEGLRSRDKTKMIMEVKSFAEAQEWLKENARPDDVVLIENDLPDLSEASFQL